MDTTLATRIVESHNARSKHVTAQHPEYISELSFTGNTRQLAPKQELYPNEHNVALQDTCLVVRFEGEFIEKYRGIGGKRIKTMRHWYFIGEIITRVEIGSHYAD